MRTLQEKYNAIQEGKFSKEHFLAEARMQQPQLITRFNGYDDAVQILKNKGMIVEAIKENIHNTASMGGVLGSGRNWDKEAEEDKAAVADIVQLVKDGTPEEQAIEIISNKYGLRSQYLVKKYQRIALGNLEEFSPYGSIAFSGEKEKEKETAPLSSLEVGDLVYIPGVSGDNIIVKDKGEDGTVGVGHPHNDKVSYQDGNKEVQVVRRANLEEAKLTKKSLTDYRYKPTNDMDKYPYEQILRGIRVELEALQVLGTPTAEEYSKALAKVSKNLEKDSIYYTNQVAGVNPKVDLHDKMVTATAKNTVDTFNGMKKAALKEGFKKLIKKVLSEDAGIASRGVEYGQPTKDEYEFYTNPEKYKDEEEDKFELQGDEEADDIPHPRGYEEASDEETEDDFFEGKKSLSELLK